MKSRFFKIDGEVYEFIGVVTDIEGRTIDIFKDKNGKHYRARRNILKKKFESSCFEWLESLNL